MTDFQQIQAAKSLNNGFCGTPPPDQKEVKITPNGQANILLVWIDGPNKGEFVYNNGHPVDIGDREARDILDGRMPFSWAPSRSDLWNYYKGRVCPVRWESGSFFVSEFK